MMQYDFWNNPLVVSAMRLKYRRSSPGFMISLYLLVLLTIGAVLHHYQDSYRMPPGLAFLVAILAIQFAVSGATALFAVGTSIHAEVANRTLDFQRIVSMKPHEILLGKIIGEPAISYSLALASLPFAGFCWFEGSISMGAILWFYVNLATFTLLCAAFGSMHTLVPPPNAASARKNNSGSIGMGLFWLPLAVLPSLMSNGTGWLQESWIGAVTNLCTPVGSLQFLFKGEPYGAQISLWGIAFPSLYVAPITQLVLTYWIVMAMSRRLKNPVDPPFKRSHTYLALCIFDLILAGSSFEQWQSGSSPTRLLATCGAAHVIACLVLLMGITPGKSVLISWLWRFQNREPWLRGSLLGSRSEITMVLPIYCLIGATVLMIGLVLPAGQNPTAASAPFVADDLLEMLAVMGSLILGCGMLHQVCVAFAGRAGLLTYGVFILLLLVVPPLVASLMLYPLPLREASGISAIVASHSPGMYYLSHLTTMYASPLPWQWLSVGSLILFFASYKLLRRWLKTQQTVVTQKLTDMAVE